MSLKAFLFASGLATTSSLPAALIIGGQPDAFDPDLAGWWDANDPASQALLQNGIWPDRSSYHRDALALGSAPYLTAADDGLSTVTFDGTTGYFDFSSVPIILADSVGSSSSVFIVTSRSFGFVNSNSNVALSDSNGPPSRFFESRNDGDRVGFFSPSGGGFFLTPDLFFSTTSIPILDWLHSTMAASPISVSMESIKTLSLAP